MIQFVSTGLDEMVLKSLNAVTPDEDLCKAMNRQGMVQKEVQVKGKTGTFTRKQWVRASDVQNSNQNQSHPKTKSDKSVTLKGAKLSLSNGSGIPESLSNVAFGFTENMRQSKFPHIKNTGYQDSAQAFREIVENANSTGKGICDALNSSGIGYRNWKVTSESSDKIVIQASDTLGNKHNLAVFPVKQKSQESSNKPTSDKGQDTSTSQVNSLVEKYAKASYDIKSAQHWGDANAETRAKSRRADITKKLKELGYKVKPDGTKGGYKAEKVAENQSKPDSQVKFDKTKSGKVGGIQVGKELATVVKTPQQGAKKLREVSDPDTGEKYDIYTSASSSSPDGIVAVKQTKDLSQMSESEIQSRMKQVTTRIEEVSKEMNNNPKSSSQLNSVATPEQKKEYDALVKENAKLMIELGKRQRKDDSDKDNVKQKDSSTTSSISFDLPSGKNTKQAVTDLLASHSRSDIMSAAKSAGITWKENAHEGINWMRASMAIQKYMSK